MQLCEFWFWLIMKQHKVPVKLPYDMRFGSLFSPIISRM